MPAFARLASVSFALLSSSISGHAQGPVPSIAPSSAVSNVFVRALKEGQASAAVPPSGRLGSAIGILQTQAGSGAPIMIVAHRVTRFEQQARCGRVSFMLTQPATHKAWSNVGGQLNICEDGLPPLQVCPERPAVLVPPSAHCSGAGRPADTSEVAAAIRTAVAAGGITPEQARATFRARSSGAASSPQGAHRAQE